MNRLITLFAIVGLALTVSACATDQKVVVEYRYVVRTAPETLKALPPQAAKIDPSTATNLDLANWIVDGEKRTYLLEDQVRSLVQFYEAPVSTSTPAAASSPAAILPTPKVIQKR